MAARIMVVDDDPAIRKLVELRFQLDDFETLSTGEPPRNGPTPSCST
jgi:DNA-binding response OmpR family regulator